MDIWRMKSDGTEEKQLTFTDDWQEGAPYFLPDNQTILYRAWRRSGRHPIVSDLILPRDCRLPDARRSFGSPPSPKVRLRRSRGGHVPSRRPLGVRLPEFRRINPSRPGRRAIPAN